MGKRRKKVGNNNTKETAGDSRFSVLTDEKDTYNPFKGLKKEDVVTKAKPTTNNNHQKQKGKNPPNPNLKKKPLVETFEEDITFEDIFSSWENGRSLDNVKKKSKNMKKSTVQGDEDFASVFAKWENSQGIAPKKKKTPPKKSDNYKPTKNFGQLLDQFEGHNEKPKEKKRQDVNQILKRTDEDDLTSENVDNKKQNTKNKKVKNFSELPKNYKIISQSASMKQKELNKFEKKNRNTEKEINKEKNTTISNKKGVSEFAKLNDKKVLEPAKIEIKNIKDKSISLELNKDEKELAKKSNSDKNVVTNKEDVSKDVIAIEKELPTESINKIEEKKDETKDKKCSWNVDSNVSEKYSKVDEVKTDVVEKNIVLDKPKKFDTKKYDKRKDNNNTKNKKDYKKRENSKKRAPFIIESKPDKPDMPAKWNFSDIYRTWSTQNEEDKAISEAKRLKDKKDNKGISISYLRSMSPQAEIDLHGLTGDVAMLRTREFLVQSRDKGFKKVSIITGKGIHSKDGKGILQDVALSEIRLSGIVREAYNPKAIDGGSGAIWVIFKSTTDKKVYF